MPQSNWWEEKIRIYPLTEGAEKEADVLRDVLNPILNKIIPAILSEHSKRIVKELEGMKRKSVYSKTGECEICGGDYLQNCVCDAYNSALDEAIKKVSELNI